MIEGKVTEKRRGKRSRRARREIKYKLPAHGRKAKDMERGGEGRKEDAEERNRRGCMKKRKVRRMDM